MRQKKSMKKVFVLVRCLAVLIFLWIIVPVRPALAASSGAQVAEKTAPVIEAIDYRTNETILQLLGPSVYTTADKYNKRTEIAKREGKTTGEITDAQVLKELKKDYVVMAYGKSFENVQKDIRQIIQRIVDQLIVSDFTNDPVFAIENNAEKILVGLVYLDRMYNFKMGDQNIRDVLIYTPDCYGKKMTKNQISWLIQIGNAGADNLKISNSTGLFGSGKVFTSNITNAATLGEFLEENRKKFIPGTTMDEWFRQTCRAYITERGSSTSTGLYSRMWADTTLRSHILPLLNVSSNSIFVIANPATITYGIVDCYVDRDLKTSNPSLYQEKINEFRQTLERAADQQCEFIQLWRRICKPGVQNLLSSNRIVLDSLRLYHGDPTADAASTWSEKFGSQAALGVNEFMTPLNMYVNFMFVDGEATGSGLRMYLSKALTERGLVTYNHEMTHLLVSSVMLNQHGIRDGMGGEVYARGMFETYESDDPLTITMNLILNRSGSENRIHNATPARFQSDKDLQTYMSGIFDVIYTLDYAEANAVLGRSAADKQKWFHKLSQIDDTGTRVNPGKGNYVHKLDKVGELSLSEAGQLNSIEDLVDHNILAARYEIGGAKTTGTLASNGYYVVPLFSANYAGVQNDKGVSGDIMIRRHAFDLLAEYGYYNGMVPYISNQYKESDSFMLSDTCILNRIFAGKYSTMADFKKAMFQKRIERTDKLRPITITWEGQKIHIQNFESLKNLMEEAVDADLNHSASNVRARDTYVERLKAEIYRAYLKQTNDFKTSIYTDGAKLPDTSAEDGTYQHLAVFCLFAVLTILAGRWMKKYE